MPAKKRATKRAATKRVPRRSLNAENEVDLTSYNEDFLLCRDLRHSWTPMGFFRNGSRIRRQLQCSRCTTTRVDTWEPNGARISNAYQYPEDYQLQGHGQLPLQLFRQEEMERFTIYETQDAMIEAAFR